MPVDQALIGGGENAEGGDQAEFAQAEFARKRPWWSAMHGRWVWNGDPATGVMKMAGGEW